MKEDKPLPCPLCNHEARLDQIKDGDDAGGYFIECTYGACGISTPLRFACGDDPKPLLLSAWNTRARLAQLESILAEAREVLEPIKGGEKMSTGFGVFLQTGGDKPVDEVIRRAATVSAKIVAMDDKQENGK